MLRKLVCLLLIITAAHAANIQIRDLPTTIVLPAANTYLIADGGTQGTARILLANLPQITTTRATLAALSVTSISTGVAVQTLGGSAVGDGSGSLYYYSSTSTATPNGTTIIQPSVGSGRWLIVTGGLLPTPSPSTLGGVFSSAPLTHQFVTGIGTDGSILTAIPAAADISGLGNMALQAQNAVTITGGSGAFTVGPLSLTLASGNALDVISSAAGTTRFVQMQTAGVRRWQFGANATAESGTAVGSDFELDATNNAGSSSFAALIISRANGSATFASGSTLSVPSGTVSTRFVTASSGFTGAIGSGTPNPGIFTTIASDNPPDIRTSKTNFNINVNVKDFGVNVGTGSDDTAAFTAAVAALPAANAVLYIPAGKYLVTTNDAGTQGLSIASRTGLTIVGDGWGSTTVKSNGPFPGGRVINVLSSCNNVDISGVTFDGGCVARTAGQQAVVLDCSRVSFHDCSVVNSGEFAVCLGRNSPMSDVIIANNFIGLNFADGINLYRVAGATVANNVLDGPDDDIIAVGLSTNVVVTGNVMRARSDLGTAWGRGLAILYGDDGVVCSNNLIEHIKQMGIYISADGGPRVNDVTISGTTVRNVCLNSGHAVEVFSADNVTLEGLHVYNPASGNCLEIRDWNNLAIRGGSLTQTLNQFCRGIHVDEDGSLSGTWKNLSIKDVAINMIGASTNSAVYLSPTAAVSMDTVSVTGIVANQTPVTDYIFVNPARVATIGKIGNNVKLQAANTVNPASSTGVITVFNNN